MRITACERSKWSLKHKSTHTELFFRSFIRALKKIYFTYFDVFGGIRMIFRLVSLSFLKEEILFCMYVYIPVKSTLHKKKKNSIRWYDTGIW